MSAGTHKPAEALHQKIDEPQAVALAPDERSAYESWLGIKPCGAAHDFGWAAWQARAALTTAQPAAQGMDALTHAELLEIKRAIQDWDEWGETDVPYELLMRGVKAGYLECGHFIPLRPGALDAAIDAAIAAQTKQGEQA